MKELSIEEKANRYDEAIEKANSLWHYKNQPCLINVSEIFPELKESEDESIKKDLIDWIEEFPDMVWRGHQKKDIIAWLENQCETKQVTDFSNLKTWKLIVDAILTKENGIGQYLDSARTETLAKELLEKFGNIQQKDFAPKSEPVFHEGDWVISKITGTVHQIRSSEIVNIDKYGYYLTDGDYISSDVVNHYRLWTINDAKDGDVLSSRHNQPFIYNGKFDDSFVGSYCGLQAYDLGFIISTQKCCWTDNENIKPSTIEQCNRLFAKMKDAGYEWDDKKKELKKVEQTIEIPFGAKDSELQEATYHIPEGYHAEVNGNEVVIKKGKQKPSWSKEDEKKRTLLIKILEVNHPNGYFKVNPANTLNMEAISTEELISWLKSL